MPASGAALVVGDDGDDVVVVELVELSSNGAVVVTVVVLGGAANDVRGACWVSSPPATSTDARIAATPNSSTVAATSATCVRPNRRLFGADGCCCGAGACTPGGYGVYPVPDGFS